MAEDLPHPAHVDADRWQGPHDALPALESLVACRPVCQLPRADHGTVPYPPGVFEIQFDFQEHEVDISTSEGTSASRPLRGESVASFYSGIFEALASLGIAVKSIPCPRRSRTPFRSTRTTPTALTTPSTRIVFGAFSSPAPRCSNGSAPGLWANAVRFTSSGAVSTWRARDFPGGLAPPRKGVISGPAYSHEVSSAGFWPGGGAVDGPAFYSYTVPQPPGIETSPYGPMARAGTRSSPSSF